MRVQGRQQGSKQPLDGSKGRQTGFANRGEVLYGKMMLSQQCGASCGWTLSFLSHHAHAELSAQLTNVSRTPPGACFSLLLGRALQGGVRARAESQSAPSQQAAAGSACQAALCC